MLIGRNKEHSQVLACIKLNRSVLVEGPVGVGKTTLIKTTLNQEQRDYLRVDGDERYESHQLVGYFDPPMIIEHGYEPEHFIAGPLVQAMQNGAILCVNELNRLPQRCQNILLSVLDEGFLDVPKLGRISTHKGFLLVATQNPADHIGTSPLSEALLDRLDWIGLDYQSRSEELQITQHHCPDAPANEHYFIVDFIRSTRQNDAFFRGASVRAGIAYLQLFIELKDRELALSMALQNRTETATKNALQATIEERCGLEESSPNRAEQKKNNVWKI